MTLEHLLSTTKRRLGTAALGAALSLGALGSQIIPYVNQNAKVTAQNASPQTITVTATYAPMGQDPRNGTAETLTLRPGQSGTLTNPLTQEGSAYVTSTGDDPVITATIDNTDGTGMNIPILDANAKNNGEPQAGIVQTGQERELFLSGDSTSTNTVTHEAWGPNGGQPVISNQIYLLQNSIGIGAINDVLQETLPKNSSYVLIPQASDQSKAAGLLLYTSPASGDTRIRKMQNFTTYTPPDPYIVSVVQHTMTNGVIGEIDTTPDNKTVEDIFNVTDLSILPSAISAGCEDIPGQSVNTIDKIIARYELLPANEKAAWSGDPAAYDKYTHDTDGDGHVCDPGEPNFIYMIDVTITPRS